MSSPLSRRRWLQSSAGTGLSLSGILQARAAGQPVNLTGLQPLRACIIVFYYGGPSHLDTYDLKPDAPAEVRGEFQPISTTVPGLFISEHLPHMSQRMHKAALIRSMHHTNRLHDSASIESLTGRQSAAGDREEFAPIPQFFPCYGSTVSYFRQALDLTVPHAALPFVFHNVVPTPCQGGGFLGSRFDPLQINVDPQAQTYGAGHIALPAGQSTASLEVRRKLLDDLQLGVTTQRTAVVERWRESNDRAVQLLQSQSIRDAMDLSTETPATRARYGYAQPVTNGEPGPAHAYAREMRGQNLLLARRLVEAGVPFVNVYDFRQQGQNWDAHAQNFRQHKDYLLPDADRSLAALLDDLGDRGLLDSTLVVAMGEFGRTPKINATGGRDHWPDCYSVLLAGGGISGGLVHGASDKTGAFPASDPVTPADLAATIYWRFGIDPASEIHDLTGRPWRIADGQPIRGLFS